MVWVHKPKPGYTLNPMRKLNRNVTCLCISGKKVKKCCGRPLYVENEYAEKVNKVLNGLDEECRKALGIKR